MVDRWMLTRLWTMGETRVDMSVDTARKSACATSDPSIGLTDPLQRINLLDTFLGMDYASSDGVALAVKTARPSHVCFEGG